MGNILDYIQWRGDIEFSYDPFNEIDNLILTELCYMDFSDIIQPYPSSRSITLKNAVNRLFKKSKKEDIVLGMILPQDIVELTDKLRFSKRFEKIRLSNFVNIINIETQIQFSAICLEISEDLMYIAFRGTDDTLIGWNEDINMLCKFPIPSQKEACLYLNRIAKMFPKKKIILGGHSKGGNLAVYSAIYCNESVQNRIITCYDNDGPGFYKNCIDQNKFLKVKKRIIKVLPDTAIVGLLFEEYCGKMIVVKSNKKGLYQHDGFTWQLCKNKFIETPLNNNALILDRKISEKIESLNGEQRADFIDDLYNFIIRTHQDTLINCSKNKFALLKACKGLNIKNARLFMNVLIQIIRFGGL